MTLLNTATALYVGGQPATAVYQGSNLVWTSGPPDRILAGHGLFLVTGESMEPIIEYVMTADNTGVSNKFVLAGQSADLVAPVAAEDAATTAWVNAVIAAGGTVSTTQRGRVDALIVAYKAAGVWTLLDNEWLFASENKTQAKVDIVGLAQWTEPSAAVIHTAGRGVKEGGFGGWIDLGVAPSTSTKFLQTSASFGAYVLTNRTTDQDSSIMGSLDLGTGSYCYFRSKQSGGMEHCLNDSNFITPTNATAQGNYLFSRTGSTTLTPYKNNVAGSAGTTAAALARPSPTWWGLRVHTTTGGGNLTDDEVASMFIGGGMNSTQALAKNAALNAYMTAQGCNVYVG